MLKSIEVVSGLLRTVLGLVIVGMLGGGAWYGYQIYHARELTEQRLADRERELEARQQELAASQAEVEQLTGKVAEQSVQIDRLDTAVRLLKVDHRVAQIVVVGQELGPDAEVETTTFNFVEVDNDQNALEQPRTFTIEGDLLYIDTWVAKFADEHVENEDPLRSTSICLFKRLFSENQAPVDGFVLDAIGSRPVAYSRGSEMSDLERDLWTNFWDYANDPERAEAAGIRSVHGEAPSIELRRGNVYKLTLRASGGLSINAERLPPGLQPFGA